MEPALKACLFGLFEERAPVGVEGFERVLELAVFETRFAGALAAGVEGGVGELLLEAAQAALCGVDLALYGDEAGGENVLLLALPRADPLAGGGAAFLPFPAPVGAGG